MKYDETVDLEANIKIKNEADKICQEFKDNVKLKIKDYVGNGKFKIWSDSHNSIYVVVWNDSFEFQCRFLHETYNVFITPERIFDGIKNNYRGVDHLKTHIAKFKAAA